MVIVLCYRKKPVGGVALFGGKDMFGEKNKDKHEEKVMNKFITELFLLKY